MVSRVAVVDKKLCDSKACNLECEKVCPVNRAGAECVMASPGKTAWISEELCVDCGLCIKRCPFHAIEIVRLLAPVEDKLVYRYGENSFALYGLALPKQGITGVIGENGCGKSLNTAILTGLVMPKRLASKEAQEFFSKIDFKQVVYKPQEISAKPLKGTVRELFDSADENGLLGQIIGEFDLQPLFPKKASELSGGELQRVILAKALSKKKEIYVLDEPLAYLDYAYRIRFVQFVKKHFSDKKVLVVDHDLSLMSYLCDSSYVLYGVSGSYGIVSQPYATDRAINQFLDGTLKSENVKFREPIAYRENNPQQGNAQLSIVPKLSFKQGSFELKNDSDIPLFDGEVVGIAGANGIGKSTLCRLLAEKNPGEAALKPQLLERSDKLVGDYLSADSPFEKAFEKEMNLRKLEFLSLKQLSGGELQKTFVFNALSQEKPLIILDEPSNMLDVLSRIKLSKLLSQKASENSCVLVVDHDLEFLLNSVDRLIVMNGVPGENGFVKGAYEKNEGAAILLEEFDLSYRRDPDSNRLKLNKRGSVKDRELKESKKFVEQ
ncbi:ribosome biogenesis/translation initiation ATPase RLI [Candidatus Micrarchaeota archaeon]|nr:ribosome biogenesis/translation initiation ATPase RLI [Candidatus Micrarchaeota archaeon]